MWKVYNEYGELYCDARSEQEAAYIAEKINGLEVFESDPNFDAYDDSWMY